MDVLLIELCWIGCVLSKNAFSNEIFNTNIVFFLQKLTKKTFLKTKFVHLIYSSNIKQNEIWNLLAKGFLKMAKFVSSLYFH